MPGLNELSSKAEKIGATGFRGKLVSGTQNQVMKPEYGVASQVNGSRGDLQVGLEVKGWVKDVGQQGR